MNDRRDPVDLPDLRAVHGKVVVVTGATSGLGRHLAGDLAPAGAQLVLHGRDPVRLGRVRDELAAVDGAVPPLTFVADLADLRQVDRLASELLDRLDRLDVLVSNAGLGFGPPGATRETSAQGIELRFAVNYLAGYLLTRRLLPLLVASAPARIVDVASIGQEALDPDDPQTERHYSGTIAYRRSKLAQIMSTIDVAGEMADTGADVTANALHPATFMDTFMVHEGGVAPLSTVEQGAAATLRLIASPELDGVTGRFFDGTRPTAPHPQADDPAVRAWLRRLSDDLVAAALTPDTPDTATDAQRS